MTGVAVLQHQLINDGSGPLVGCYISCDKIYDVETIAIENPTSTAQQGAQAGPGSQLPPGLTGAAAEDCRGDSLIVGSGLPGLLDSTVLARWRFSFGQELHNIRIVASNKGEEA